MRAFRNCEGGCGGYIHTRVTPVLLVLVSQAPVKSEHSCPDFAAKGSGIEVASAQISKEEILLAVPGQVFATSIVPGSTFGVAEFSDIQRVLPGKMVWPAPLGIAAVAFLAPKLVAMLPPAMINLPNKDYWLAPERRAETVQYLEAAFAWFGCALYLVLFFALNYAVGANLHRDRHPDSSGIWIPLVAFVSFTLVWSTRLALRFTRMPNNNN